MKPLSDLALSKPAHRVFRFTILAGLGIATGCSNPTVPEEQPSPAPAPTEAPVPWKSVWPLEDGSWVAGKVGEGSLVSDSAKTDIAAGVPCDSGTKVEGNWAIWAPTLGDVTFMKPPMVTASLVERASWRLAEIVPPTTAIQPGVDAPDPALYQGIRVRSVRKIRRNGPPWQAVIGERGSNLLIAITDRDVKTIASSAVIVRSQAAPAHFSMTPPVQLDGEGDPEILFFADSDATGFRAVFSIDLTTGSLTQRSFDERPELPNCP